MKKLQLLFFSAILIFTGISLSHCQSQPNRVEEVQGITLADPTIFFHDDVYYLYGTSQGELGNLGKGFLVFTSDDMKNWQGPKGANNGFALKEGDAFGTNGFWAPQIFEYDRKFYMAYTANENIAMATSESPLGPFINSGEVLKASVKQIDPYVFIDDDGKKYLYHVRLQKGNQIFVAELTEDLKGLKMETLTHCISAEEVWENTEKVEWSVSEGPTVIKNRGIYYLVYSANDFRNSDYAVGYATSTSPFGPWKKSEGNPIIDKQLVGESGPGHGDIFLDKDGGFKYVLHTHFSEEEVHPRKTALIDLQFKEGEDGRYSLTAVKETFKFLRTDEPQ